MNRFLKTNILWLGFLGIAMFIVILAYIFRPASQSYAADAKASLQLINKNSNSIDLQYITGKQLVDVRPENLYAQGHAMNAINIPVRKLLDKESIALLRKLSKGGAELIFYGSNELEATAPVLLLQQLGVENLKILRGGYSPSSGLMQSSLSASEESTIDPTAFQIKAEELKSTDIKGERKSEVVVPTKKSASAGGGC